MDETASLMPENERFNVPFIKEYKKGILNHTRKKKKKIESFEQWNLLTGFIAGYFECKIGDFFRISFKNPRENS